MSTLPAVALDLSDFAHPHCSEEWVYGPRRVGVFADSYPISATAAPAPGEATVEFRGPLGLDRDQIPHLIAWLTAVYAATEQAAVEEVAS